MTEVWYRCEAHRYASLDWSGEVCGSRVELYWSTYSVLRRTTKGVWLQRPFAKPRFVLHTATKRFANPTRYGALVSLRARQTRKISIYRARIVEAEEAIRLSEHAT